MANGNFLSWWDEQERISYYSQPINKTEPEYLAFIRKRKFTVREFATLLAGLRPWVFDNSDLADKVYASRVKPFLELLLDDLSADLVDKDEDGWSLNRRECWVFDNSDLADKVYASRVKPFLELLLDDLSADLVDKDEDGWSLNRRECPWILLGDEPSINVFDWDHRENTAFHVQSYFRYCEQNNIPFPIESEWVRSITRPPQEDVLNLPLANGEPSNQCEGQPLNQRHEVPSDKTQIEIIEGVTVGDLLEMINANQALGDVLQAVNSWRKLPEERKTLPNSLYSGLNIKAKANGWGNNPDGQLARKQYEEIGDIFIQSSKKRTGKRGNGLFPSYDEATRKK